MFTFIIKKLRFWMQKMQDQLKETPEEPQPKQQQGQAASNISASLETNIGIFQEALGTSNDVKIHTFLFGANHVCKGAIIFIDGLVESDIITQSIMKPLILSQDPDRFKAPGTMDAIRQTMLCSGDIGESSNLSKLIYSCLSGDTVFLVDGFDQGLIVSSRGWDKRSVSEPQTESVVRGPREGFTENFRTNTSLLRRKIKNPALRMESMAIGDKTHTDVCIIYLKGVADPQLIETIKYRLGSLRVDSIMDSGYIEQYIEDNPFSIFPTVGYSEKPDVIAAKILEGRAAILVDGSPFVLTAPMLFIESFQTAEDYYIRTFYASILRMLRYLAFFVSIFAPAIYIALTTFHQELIPTTLLFTIAQAREGTPFTAFIEAAIMVFAFEILREAGLRLPRPVGQAVSIVGALVMGDAAVSAGLVGAPMVITVAITAVAGFVVPDQSDSASIMRVILMILGASLGGYGIAVGFLVILVHLASLRSFGVPYFSGLAPARAQTMKDIFIRAPLWSMTKRPKEIAHGDMIRRKYMVPPAEPPRQNESDSQGESK